MKKAIEGISKSVELQNIFTQEFPALFAGDAKMAVKMSRQELREQLPLTMAQCLFEAFENETKGNFDTAEIGQDSVWYTPLRSYVILKRLEQFVTVCRLLAKQSSPWEVNVKSILHLMGSALGIQFTFKEPLVQRQVLYFVEGYLSSAFGKLLHKLLGPKLILPEAFYGSGAAESYLAKLSNGEVTLASFDNHCMELSDKIGAMMVVGTIVLPAPSAAQYELVFESKELKQPVDAKYYQKHVLVSATTPPQINRSADNLFYVDKDGEIFQVMEKRPDIINEFLSSTYRLSSRRVENHTLKLTEGETTHFLKLAPRPADDGMDATGALIKRNLAVIYYMMSPPAPLKSSTAVAASSASSSSSSAPLSTFPGAVLNASRSSSPVGTPPAAITEDLEDLSFDM